MERQIIMQNSTIWFINKFKLQSYPINEEHAQRGLALTVTMTTDREGWKEDVRALNVTFKSLNIGVTNIYDKVNIKLTR